MSTISFVHDFLRRNLLAVHLPPVVGVDFLPDDQVAHVLRNRQLRHFFRVFGLMIDAVGRPEEDGLHANNTFDQPLRQVQLPMNLSLRDVIERWMGISMVAYFMAFSVFPLHDLRPLTSRHADHEKCRGDFLFLEDVQDFGRPAIVGAIVKGNRDFVVGRAELIDVVGERIGIVIFAGDEIAGPIVNEAATAALRSVGEMPHVSVAFKNEIRAWWNVFDFFPHRVVRPR